MLPREIKVGYVLRYSYLWHSEKLEGRDEGIENRPCVVLALVQITTEGKSIVRVLPVTHAVPRDMNLAVEIPADTKKRLRLDDRRSWIILSESNTFAWLGPDVRQPHGGSDDGYYGQLPRNMFDEIRQRFASLARSGRHKAVPRTE